MFRDLIVGLAQDAKTDTVSISIGKMLDRSGYLKDLREENTEEANERTENLMELVSAARDYESRDPEASLGGFVDRLSLLSEVDEEQGTKNARVWLMSMHAAKGLEFPVVFIAGMEENLFPHSRSSEDEDELEEERRLFYVGMTRAESRLFLTGAARRRHFGEYQSTEPSRFLDEVPSELVERITPAYSSSHQGSFAHAHYEFRTNPYSRGGRPARFKEETPRYEDEDQSATGVRVGHAREARAVRRRGRARRRGAHGRLQDHGAVQQRGPEEAAGELREVGARVGAVREPPTRSRTGCLSRRCGRSRTAPTLFRLERLELARRSRRRLPSPPASPRETTASPSSISISLTPCVARPMVRMSPAFMRRIMPCCEISISSSSSCT